MKKYVFLLIAICFSLSITAQVDRSKAPESGPAPRVHIGEYKSFTLNNGLKVLVVENNKIPKVNFSLNIVRDKILEKDKAGYLNIAGELWGKGTEKRNPKQLSEEVDFIGANLYTSSEYVGIAGLAKYKDQMMEILSDVVLHPTFPKEEFDKLILRTQTGLKTSEVSPQAIMSNIYNKTLFGDSHPYGDVITPATISNVTIEDCQNYYQNYIHPNHAVLVIVGDITLNEAKKLTEKYLGNWKAGQSPAHTYEVPKQPQGRQVIFSNKDAATQASIQVAYPINFKVNSPDAIAAQVMNQILGGGGFQAKLFKNLRETKGYTYGAYSSLSKSELPGSGAFSASAEVKSNIADSALIEVFKEMQNMVMANYSQEDLERVKKTMAGSFSRSLESPSTIANFAYNIERFGLPKDYYTTYLEKLDKVTKEDVNAAVKKYIHPDNAYILVVNDRGEKKKLEKLATNGTVTELDNYGEPLTVSNNVAPNITPEKVIDAYLKAIGGAEKIKGIKDMSLTSEMNIQGMKLITSQKYLLNGAKPLYLMEMSMNGATMQKIVFDGTKAIISGAGGNQTLEGEKVAELKAQTYPVLEAEYAQLGYHPTLEGVEKVNGRDAYKLKTTLGKAVTYSFYDVENGLKVKAVGSQDGMTQEVLFEDYQPTEYGILMPLVSKTSMQGMPIEVKTTDIKINSGLKAGDFQ
ncbi:pitrilysin family protein [uncultured Odoribacter sp.]|uniref:M16 family metallopeptidase n=1 Tax=uncultured Odoribacter sp. TaxID=876416 RepID=UPI002620E505|nr:pitrilysin family protein [uncultured Odoribacter sp.]